MRKATLRSMLAKAGLDLRFNEHMEGDGPTIFAHACKMGLEGIVSKGKDSIYRSGRSTDWPKFKKPPAPAVTAWGCRALLATSPTTRPGCARRPHRLMVQTTRCPTYSTI